MSSCGRSKEILNVTIVSSLQQSLMKSTQMSDLIPSNIISSNSLSTKNRLFLLPFLLCFYRRLSVHRGVSASVHAGIPPPGVDTPPLEQTPPQFFFFSFLLFFAFFTPPPEIQETATAADGTHPTGMHSCFLIKLHRTSMSVMYAEPWFVVIIVIKLHVQVSASKHFQGSHFSGLTKFPDFSLTFPVFFAIFPVLF